MSFWNDFTDACQADADFAEENSSLIFLISGIALGVAAAAVAVVEGKKVTEKLEEKHEAEKELDEELSKPVQVATDIVAAVPCYWGAIVLGAGAIFCLVKSYNINMGQIATLGAALSVAEKKNREYDIYRQKVREAVGKNKEEKIKHEVTKEEIRRDPPPKSFLEYDESDGKMRMKNLNTGSYFRSTPEEIRRVETIITHRCYTQEYTKLSEFLYELDVNDRSDAADVYGWPMGSFPEVSFEPVLLDDGVTTITGVRFFRDEDEIIGNILKGYGNY